jgi:hypothetical protein
MVLETKVPRFDAVGFPKPVVEYYSGIAAAVYLAEIMRSDPDYHTTPGADVPAKKVEAFLDALAPYIGQRLEASSVLPAALRERVQAGWTNYKGLRQSWTNLAAEIAPRILEHVMI